MLSIIEFVLIILGAIGGIMTNQYPLTGYSLVGISVIGAGIQLWLKWVKEKKSSDYNLSVAQVMVEANLPNPLIKQMENELKAKGKIEDVASRYLEVLIVDPNNEEAVNGYLVCYGLWLNSKRRMGKLSKNAPSFDIDQFLKKHRSKIHLLNDQGKLGLAMSYDAIGDYRFAQTIYKDLLKVRPKDGGILSIYSMSLLMSERVRNSYKIMKLSMKYSRPNAVLLFNMACVEEAMGHFDAAIYLNVSVGKVMGSKLNYKHLARALALRGDLFLSSVVMWYFFLVSPERSLREAGHAIVCFLMAIVTILNLLLSLTVGRIPIVKRVFYYFYNPAFIQAEIMIKCLKEFPDAYFYALQHLKFMIILNPTKFEYVLNLSTLFAKTGFKDSAIKVLRQMPFGEVALLTKRIELFEKMSIDEMKNIKIDFLELKK